MAQLRVGLARARLGPAAALINPDRGSAACEENRLTRARQVPSIGPPTLSVPELAAYLGASENDIATVAVVRDPAAPAWWKAHKSVNDRRSAAIEIDPHTAHAEYVFRASGFDEAVTVVCDDAVPDGYTAFLSSGSAIRPLASVGRFPIARVYGEVTEGLGLQAARDEHLVEAMARAGDGRARVADLISIADEGMTVAANLRAAIEQAVSTGADRERTRLDCAAAAQQRLGHCMVELLQRLSRTTSATRVCLSGGLFFNTHFTTTAAASGAFAETYVPPHPGRNGSAMGAALVGGGPIPPDVGSPYLGPGYSDPQIKEALENCKLAYDLQREEQVIETVLRALSRGQLVGWYHGRLEWGPRALGHRTVLADPRSAHVLENLNGYLKKRPAHRTYGVSVPMTRLSELFDGSRPSPFMQYRVFAARSRHVPGDPATGRQDAARTHGRRAVAALSAAVGALGRHLGHAGAGQHVLQRIPRAVGVFAARRDSRVLRHGPRPAGARRLRPAQVGRRGDGVRSGQVQVRTPRRRRAGLRAPHSTQSRRPARPVRSGRSANRAPRAPGDPGRSRDPLRCRTR